MRKILGILVVLLLVFITNSNMVFADQEKTSVIVIDNDKEIPNEEILAVEELKKPSEPTEEEKFYQKLEQDLALSSTLMNLISDIMQVEDMLLKLEAFQKNPVISEKIKTDWMPVLRKYRQVLGDVYLELKKMLNRSDFIPWEKVRTDLKKYYPEKLVNDVNRVLTEMAEVGL